MPPPAVFDAADRYQRLALGVGAGQDDEAVVQDAVLLGAQKFLAGQEQQWTVAPIVELDHIDVPVVADFGNRDQGR